MDSPNNNIALTAFRNYCDTVLRTVYNIVHSYSEAEDITQEVFLKLHENPQNFESETHLKAWLLRSAINRAKNYHKSFRVKMVSPIDETNENCFAEDFTPVAEKIKAAGMKFMYHNHSFEFVHLPCGKTIMDALLEKMPADLMGITADTYWLQIAGVDVNAWMASHADRLPCIHLKDLVPASFETRMAAVGQGNINFPAILDTVSKNGVTEYALVEQDNCYGESPFECLKKSYDHLKKLGY